MLAIPSPVKDSTKERPISPISARSLMPSEVTVATDPPYKFACAYHLRF